MLCFSLKKKSTIFFRTVSSWTPEYYVLRETTEVRYYIHVAQICKYFFLFCREFYTSFFSVLIQILYLSHLRLIFLSNFMIFIVPFSVVVLGNFRRFLLVIFLFLFLHLDFSFIYSKFSMPFWGFFY